MRDARREGVLSSRLFLISRQHSTPLMISASALGADEYAEATARTSAPRPAAAAAGAPRRNRCRYSISSSLSSAGTFRGYPVASEGGCRRLDGKTGLLLRRQA